MNIWHVSVVLTLTKPTILKQQFPTFGLGPPQEVARYIYQRDCEMVNKMGEQKQNICAIQKCVYFQSSDLCCFLMSYIIILPLLTLKQT